MHIFNDIPLRMELGLSDDANGKSSTFTMNCNAIGYTNKLCGHPVTGEYTGELRCDPGMWRIFLYRNLKYYEQYSSPL